MRYRANVGSTRQARQRFHNLGKLGTLTAISGERYRASGVTQEVVRVCGRRGTARFAGLCWSYSGEGPRGLRDLLLFCGAQPWVAHQVAFEAPRNYPDLGKDWELILTHDRVSYYASGRLVWWRPVSDAWVDYAPVEMIA